VHHVLSGAASLIAHGLLLEERDSDSCGSRSLGRPSGAGPLPDPKTDRRQKLPNSLVGSELELDGLGRAIGPLAVKTRVHVECDLVVDDHRAEVLERERIDIADVLELLELVRQRLSEHSRTAALSIRLEPGPGAAPQ
jgi:hypothetical protein